MNLFCVGCYHQGASFLSQNKGYLKKKISSVYYFVFKWSFKMFSLILFTLTINTPLGHIKVDVANAGPHPFRFLPYRPSDATKDCAAFSGWRNMRKIFPIHGSQIKTFSMLHQNTINTLMLMCRLWNVFGQMR